MIIKLFSVSNYSQQAKGLPVQDGIQVGVLWLADCATLVREISKVGTITGTVCLVAGTAFANHFDSNFAWKAIVAPGAVWLISGFLAKKLEPEARDMIQDFKELKEGKDLIHPNDAKRFGLVD